MWRWLLVALACTGCAHERVVSTRVDTREIDTPGAARYEMAANKKYIPPAFMSEPADPVYPPELLPQRLPPRAIAARVVVDESGSVTAVTPIEPLANEADERFFAAIVAACESWRYAPYTEVADTPIETPNDDGTVTTEYPSRALPFHLDYAFTFSQQDGRATVSAARAENSAH
jgi:hypothetical protein